MGIFTGRENIQRQNGRIKRPGPPGGHRISCQHRYQDEMAEQYRGISRNYEENHKNYDVFVRTVEGKFHIMYNKAIRGPHCREADAGLLPAGRKSGKGQEAPGKNFSLKEETV